MCLLVLWLSFKSNMSFKTKWLSNGDTWQFQEQCWTINAHCLCINLDKMVDKCLNQRLVWLWHIWSMCLSLDHEHVNVSTPCSYLRHSLPFVAACVIIEEIKSDNVMRGLPHDLVILACLLLSSLRLRRKIFDTSSFVLLSYKVAPVHESKGRAHWSIIINFSSHK